MQANYLQKNKQAQLGKKSMADYLIRASVDKQMDARLKEHEQGVWKEVMAYAEILLQDLQIKTMDLVAGAAKLKDYADKNHKNAKCFCISPKVADGILREFYGLEKPGEAEKKPAAAEAQESGFIDLEAFL